MKKLDTYKHLLHRARQRPDQILTGLFAILNGYWHKLKFFLLMKNVKIGRGFRVYGTFRILGSGKVLIGDNCFIQSKLIKPVAMMAAFPNTTIEIGHNTGFNGTTIQCYDKIVIEDWCNIADAYIIDSPAHFLSADRRFRDDRELSTAPVILKRNVWISTRVTILHGVTIGNNSVIGACSLVRNDVESDSLYAGSPARFIKKIPPSQIPIPFET